MLKLKLQYFGHLMGRTNSWKRPWCWEKLKAGGEGNNRWWDDWIALLTRWTWVWASSWSCWWTGKPGMLRSLRVAKSWTWLSNWTELNWLKLLWALVAQMVKNLPAMQETQVRSLGRFPGEGNGNPLQYSCLENPMDRGACWATVCGVPKSRTRLTLLSYFPKKLPGKRGVSQLLLIRCFDWRPKANSVLAMKTFVCFYALKSVSS